MVHREPARWHRRRSTRPCCRRTLQPEGGLEMSDRACLYACLAQFIVLAIAFAIINA
jgi:hypothetical protein